MEATGDLWCCSLYKLRKCKRSHQEVIETSIKVGASVLDSQVEILALQFNNFWAFGK